MIIVASIIVFCNRKLKMESGKSFRPVRTFNEMIHHISVVLSIYKNCVDQILCKETIDLYDKSCRQLTKLANSWKDFHEEKH